ncbi:GNAT family N-acetyltransferase [Spelaeicoccus albus]|uniref:Ribosomal protein S18 acetylase RimI-like enzyme n=1 Tax=Spelaeicoccus albus TaxID=1280376 RepID=A0A7Z0A8W3_9MICO|nr:GNAT family N-acetyltransferase [Spelaeicoccus albus]NYI66544.1 ribosomal protein S18 acetylase RimI-like enzyme [Spelaeicoccus albus]
MSIKVSTPDVAELAEIVGALRDWQDDDVPLQLHPGDLGWYWLRGAAATAGAIRAWRRNGQIVAVGLLDGPELLRVTSAPDAQRDEELARTQVADAIEPARGILPAGEVAIEAPTGALVHDLLLETGWRVGEPWTPLQRDLTEAVEDAGIRIEAIGPDRASEFAAVHQSAFGSAKFTDRHWRTMAAGLPYAGARSVVAYDDDANPVAAVTVWSAGPGKPGLLEPMGVHADHRGRGYGRAISVAAAAALRQLGSSSAMVCTPSSNRGAVATYQAAGFRPLPERHDSYREN